MDNLRQEILAFFSNSKNRILIYVLFTIIVLIAIGSAVLLITSNQNKPVLTKDEEKEIIEEIVKNNPGTILEESIINNKPEYTAPEVAQLGKPSETPDLTKYNYREVEYVYKSGPAYNACSFRNSMGGDIGSYYFISNYSKGNYKYTTTEYFEKNKTLYTNLIESTNKAIFNYSLSEYSNLKSETYNYAGGDYAILAQYEAYPGYTQEEYVEYPASYTNYYKESPYYEFIGEEIVNGKNSYKIKSEYYTFCNDLYGQVLEDANGNDQNVVKIITITYADKITYSINRTQTYLNNISESSLISQSDSKVKTALVKHSDVAAKFTFSYDVPVKTIDYRGYWDLQNQAIIKSNTKNYLSNSNIQLLNLSAYVLTSVNVPAAYPKLANSDYIEDRAFYPDTEEGDSFYNLWFKFTNQLMSEVTVYLTRNVPYEYYKYAYVNIYPLGTTSSQLIDQKLSYTYDSYNLSDTFTLINGESVPVKKLTTNYKYYYLPASYALVSGPVSYPYHLWSDTAYIFEYEGRVYNISTSEDISNLDFDSYASNNSAELDLYMNLILGYNYFYPTSYASYPVSYGYQY